MGGASDMLERISALANEWNLASLQPQLAPTSITPKRRRSVSTL